MFQKLENLIKRLISLLKTKDKSSKNQFNSNKKIDKNKNNKKIDKDFESLKNEIV